MRSEPAGAGGRPLTTRQPRGTFCAATGLLPCSSCSRSSCWLSAVLVKSNSAAAGRSAAPLITHWQRPPVSATPTAARRGCGGGGLKAACAVDTPSPPSNGGLGARVMRGTGGSGATWWSIKCDRYLVGQVGWWCWERVDEGTSWNARRLEVRHPASQHPFYTSVLDSMRQ